MPSSLGNPTKDDINALRRLARGGQLMTSQEAKRLEELGLADQKLGGVAINSAGKRLLKNS